MKKVSWLVVAAGLAVGIAAVVLTLLGNPSNMGFCIACFLRDIAGACGLHSAAKVQYVRPRESSRQRLVPRPRRGSCSAAL